MKRTNLFTAFALALVMTGGILSESEAQRRGRPTPQNLVADENADGISDGQILRHRRGHKQRRMSLASGLTLEQRGTIEERLSNLRTSGASGEEIGTALAAELTAAGVELPKDFAERTVLRENKRAERTAQREQIKTIVDGLKAEGATRAEIRQVLQEAGYNKPRGRKEGRRGDRKPLAETDAPTAE